jgi:hypothetical protein
LEGGKCQQKIPLLLCNKKKLVKNGTESPAKLLYAVAIFQTQNTLSEITGLVPVGNATSIHSDIPEHKFLIVTRANVSIISASALKKGLQLLDG